MGNTQSQQQHASSLLTRMRLQEQSSQKITSRAKETIQRGPRPGALPDPGDPTPAFLDTRTPGINNPVQCQYQRNMLRCFKIHGYYGLAKYIYSQGPLLGNVTIEAMALDQRGE